MLHNITYMESGRNVSNFLMYVLVLVLNITASLLLSFHPLLKRLSVKSLLKSALLSDCLGYSFLCMYKFHYMFHNSRLHEIFEKYFVLNELRSESDYLTLKNS